MLGALGFNRPVDYARLLLWGGTLLSMGAADLAWGRDSDRERGGYGSYDDPVERPVLPMPGAGITVGAVSEAPTASPPSLEEQLAKARRLLGRAVIGPDGDVLGTVRGIARSRQGDPQLLAVVAIAGFLGLDKKHVLVPLEQLLVQSGEAGQQQVKAGVDQESLDQMLEYRPELFDLVLPAARQG